MASKTETKEFILKCKPMDPKDPSTLACRIVSKRVFSKGELNHDTASNDSQPKSSESEPVKTVPDATEMIEEAGDELLTVRKHTLDGKVFLEVIEPTSHPEPNAVEMTDRKTEDSGCDGKHCPISKFGKYRKKNPTMPKNKETNDN
ncbi:hypothetical protein [Methanoregula sp.]|uniref:hypothetical protein n=1 Tax=Methanoregula sp. TaxID=2052170 RepID=UPI002626032F|nr:hypothetical protein [Methanoregula sp.]